MRLDLVTVSVEKLVSLEELGRSLSGSHPLNKVKCCADPLTEPEVLCVSCFAPQRFGEWKGTNRDVLRELTDSDNVTWRS